MVALQIEGEPASTYNSLTLNKMVTASGNQDSAKGINDDDGATRWKNTNSSGWFTVDLGKPETFTTLRISPAYGDVKTGQLEVKEGDAWKTILKDMALKRDENIISFLAATGQVIRFSFTNETNPPQISDFELYPNL